MKGYLVCSHRWHIRVTGISSCREPAVTPLFVHLFCDQVVHWLPPIGVINLFANSICAWGYWQFGVSKQHNMTKTQLKTCNEHVMSFTTILPQCQGNTTHSMFRSVWDYMTLYSHTARFIPTRNPISLCVIITASHVTWQTQDGAPRRWHQETCCRTLL